MGIMGALENDFGVTGIAPDAQFGFAGFIEGNGDISEQYIKGIVEQIKKARELLDAGDIMVIEQQVTGPKGDYILVEYFDEIFNELKAATDKGIHCVAAAGNGGSNLDSAEYKNLLNRSVRDSGCIVVGAAGIGTNSRLYFSNYGQIVDAFGYGGSVAATGYGDLFNAGPNAIYTNKFSGTSSATPIVAGAVALVSSIALQQGVNITPAQMRKALRATGVPQRGTVSENIGKFPHIGALLSHFKLKK
jgi:subtilisin family serine protease